jgi:RNA polymerase sigma-70 factor (ECF subfamily)
MLHSMRESRVSPPSPDGDERALLRRLRTGDAAAFETLVRTNAPRLLSVARRLLRNEEDARDALQEAFLQAFRGIGRFEGGARLSTWLHRIVVNASLMRLRSRGRRPEQPIEELLPRFYEDGHRIDPGPPWRSEGVDPIEQREIAARVRAAIDRLPEIYRNVLLLRDIEELDTQETARLLDVKVDTVKVRLHRARQALRALLAPEFTSGDA